MTNNIIMNYKELYNVYKKIQPKIDKRIKGFLQIGKSKDDFRIFQEFVFCLLTPQSKAEVCWRAVESLVDKGLLLKGDTYQIERELNGVRFRRNKARYIVEAREKFFKNNFFKLLKVLRSFKRAEEQREFLVKNIKGMGYKEASHFLRNIGWGLNLAILDRHILRCLNELGIISHIPDSLSRRSYLHIEELFREFSTSVDIPFAHLDFVFWYIRTGRIFK